MQGDALVVGQSHAPRCRAAGTAYQIFIERPATAAKIQHNGSVFAYHFRTFRLAGINGKKMTFTKQMIVGNDETWRNVYG